MSKNPKVSVIVPVYNTGKYLPECLDSLVNQTLDDIEIICVNDGSTDNSKDILKKYAEKYSSIKLINLKVNAGLSNARNVGIRASKGNYLGFIDSDDFVNSTYYEILYMSARKTNSDIVGGNVLYLFKTRRTEKTYITTYNEIINLKIIHNFKDKESMILTTAVWNKIFKKELILKNKITFPNRLFWEDNSFLYKAVLYSKNIYINNEAIYFWRKRKSSTMSVAKSDLISLDIFKIVNIIIGDLITYNKRVDINLKNFTYYFIYILIISRYDQLINENIKNKFFIKMRSFFEINHMNFIENSYLQNSDKYFLYKLIKTKRQNGILSKKIIDFKLQ